jgi:hypothetical protein
MGKKCISVSKMTGLSQTFWKIRHRGIMLRSAASFALAGGLSLVLHPFFNLLSHAAELERGRDNSIGNKKTDTGVFPKQAWGQVLPFAKKQAWGQVLPFNKHVVRSCLLPNLFLL